MEYRASECTCSRGCHRRDTVFAVGRDGLRHDDGARTGTIRAASGQCNSVEQQQWR
ncbi:hypothetical protein HF908_23480 (plasmid) [Ralstonia pseudosolanacearum]|nr:hypothetical protein HF908_23480 [Ralstonia pseudosolanacearum]